MIILKRVFAILTFCGCWRPRDWTSQYKKMVYNIYMVFIILVVYGLTITQLLDILFNVENQDDFSDNFYLLLAMIVSCCKMNNLLLSRSNIAILMDILEEHPHVPISPEEFEIRRRFDKETTSNTTGYLILVESSVILLIVSSLFTKFRNRNLVFRAWLPYDYSSTFSYSLTFLHQSMAWTAGSLMHVSCDGLLCGLLVHICCQIEILGHRLNKIEKGDTISIKACARHHENIYRFAMMVNKQFNAIILTQFMVSTLVVCFNLYVLTATKGITSKMLYIMIYSSCMLTQIFFYCWYGNEVKVKSLDMANKIYQSQWMQLNVAARKSLLIIMQHSTVPIEFTSGHIFSMNLESFMNLLKTSYSAYNMLQQTQNV